MSSISLKQKCLVGLSSAALLAAMAPSFAFAEVGSRYTSNITISGVEAGATVNAYEIADTVVDSSNNLSYVFANGVDGDAYKNLQSNSAEMKQMAGQIATGIATHTVTPIDTKQQTSNGNDIVISNADDGLWLIVITGVNGSTKVYSNTIINNTPTISGGNYVANPQTVTVKSEATPTLNKTIGDTNQQATHAYQIADLVPFTVTTTIPNYPVNYTDPTFVINDTPGNGLIDQADTVEVEVSGAGVAASNYDIATVGNGFKLTFHADFIKTHIGQPVTVKYKAKLTSDAFKSATDVTKNGANLEYNTTPGVVHTSDTISDEVHTYGFFFQKVDKNQASLTGAEFTLYDETGNNEIKDENGQPLKSTSDAQGYVWFEDLADGKTYTVKETKVPAGKQAVSFTVTISQANATLDNPATGTIQEANYQKFSSDNKVVDPDQGVLPITGGPGTIAITIAGAALIFGGVYVVTRSLKRQDD